MPTAVSDFIVIKFHHVDLLNKDIILLKGECTNLADF